MYGKKKYSALFAFDTTPFVFEATNHKEIGTVIFDVA
jgi:hypothetical protein